MGTSRKGYGSPCPEPSSAAISPQTSHHKAGGTPQVAAPPLPRVKGEEGPSHNSEPLQATRSRPLPVKGQDLLHHCIMPWRIERARLEETVAHGGEPSPGHVWPQKLSRARPFQHRLCPIRRPSPKRVAPPPIPCGCTCHTEIEFQTCKRKTRRRHDDETDRAKIWIPVHTWQLKRQKNHTGCQSNTA